MNNSPTAAMRTQALPIGMLLLSAAAFTLIQLTSLVLGPSPSRQFKLSLAVPTVDLEEVPNSVGSQVDLVVGAVIAAAAPADRQTVDRAVLTHSSLIAASQPLRSSVVVKPVVAVTPVTQVVASPVTPVTTPPSVIALPPALSKGADRAAGRGHSERKERGEGRHSDRAPDKN